MTCAEAINALQAATDAFVAAIASLSATVAALPEAEMVIDFGNDGATVAIRPDKSIVFSPGVLDTGHRSMYDRIVSRTIHSPPARSVGKKTGQRYRSTAKVK